MKRRLKAENVSAQEFISEFASRVVFLAELNEVGQLRVNGFQLIWGRGKQFSPMRPGLEWRQFFLDYGQQRPDRGPVLFPGKVNGDAGLFVAGTQP
jgi:hypothetical protein